MTRPYLPPAAEGTGFSAKAPNESFARGADEPNGHADTLFIRHVSPHKRCRPRDSHPQDPGLLSASPHAVPKSSEAPNCNRPYTCSTLDRVWGGGGGGLMPIVQGLCLHTHTGPCTTSSASLAKGTMKFWTRSNAFHFKSRYGR